MTTSPWTNCKRPQLGLNILQISDIHLLHSRTPTDHILTNFENQFYSDHSNKLLDIIMISGDVFDGLRTLNDERLWDVELFIMRLLKFCKEHDIIVRILEGTPSHDAKQCRMFESINTIGDYGVDLRHVTVLEIELIKRHGLTVLYVPDEWKSGPAHAWADVKQALKENNLTSVHYAMMHGTFPHQLPPGVNSPIHDPDDYNSVVTEMIQIGHIHFPSLLGKISVPGSYDRTAHGEEHSKGYNKVFLKGNGVFDITFHPNPNPYPYVNVNVTGKEAKEALTLIEDKVKSLTRGFLQVSGEKGHPVFNGLGGLKERYPTIVFTTKANKDKGSNLETLQENVIERASAITITTDNIHDVVKRHLDLLGCNDESVYRHLKECIHEL